MYTEMMGGCRTGKTEPRKGLRYLIWLHFTDGKVDFFKKVLKVGDKKSGIVRVVPKVYHDKLAASRSCDKLPERPTIEKASIVVMT